MKEIVKYFLLAVVVASAISCTKSNFGTAVTVEHTSYSDSYYNYPGSELILLECDIDSFLEGESMVHVWIRNRVWDRTKKSFILEVETDTYLTTNDFQRELRKVNRKSRTGNTVQFCITYRGLEISWDMFDQIYKDYYTWK